MDVSPRVVENPAPAVAVAVAPAVITRESPFPPLWSVRACERSRVPMASRLMSHVRYTSKHDMGMVFCHYKEALKGE